MSATPPERGRGHGDAEQAVGGGRARALILDHHLIPEHTHSRQVDDATAAYRWPLDQRISGDHIAFTGGSSGGRLSITTQLRARERGLALPAAAMLFSPWTWKSSGSRTNAPGLGRLLLHGGRTRVGGIFLGEGGDSRDPLAYPLYADLTGLGTVRP
jgi:epsilon-lactone hydrolase